MPKLQFKILETQAAGTIEYRRPKPRGRFLPRSVCNRATDKFEEAVIAESNMRDMEREMLAVKAYRLAEMSADDWKAVMAKYYQDLKTSRVIPNIVWYFMAVLAVVAMLLDWFPPWFRVVGAFAVLLLAMRFENRKGNKEGFQDGYEWGKQDGVCKALGISMSEQPDLMELARKVIVEFKVESGDPNLEIGKEWRDGRRKTRLEKDSQD